MSDFFADHTSTFRGMGVFRGATADDATGRCEAAWRVGAELIEFTVESADGLRALHAASVQAGDRPIGAGTVTTTDRLHAALESGARFVVTPGVHRPVIEECLRAGVPVLPGVSTATEIAAAMELGLRWLKLFPASLLTPAWVSAMKGPFPEVSFIASGGIGADNASAFLGAGCHAVASGSVFTSRKDADRFAAAVRLPAHPEVPPHPICRAATKPQRR